MFGDAEAEDRRGYRGNSNQYKPNEVGTSVTANTGEVIDTTPANKHIIVTENPGYIGTPNSSDDILDSDGNLITRRWYGVDGKAMEDVDFNDHGNPKLHPNVPHSHTWSYGPDGKPTGRK